MVSFQLLKRYIVSPFFSCGVWLGSLLLHCDLCHGGSDCAMLHSSMVRGGKSRHLSSRLTATARESERVLHSPLSCCHRTLAFPP